MRERAEPIYPDEARRKGIGGTVKLSITVAADGSVGEIQLTSRAGFGLDEATPAAVRRFTFKPATEHGHAIASMVIFEQMPIGHTWDISLLWCITS